MYKFSERSLKKLNGVHPSMIYILLKAIKTSPVDFSILEGVRSQERQKQLYKSGASRCDGVKNKSNHQVKENGFGYAVDLAPYPIDWKDTKRFKILSEHIKKVAKELEINIRWGGDFKSLVDMPHYELI